MKLIFILTLAAISHFQTNSAIKTFFRPANSCDKKDRNEYDEKNIFVIFSLLALLTDCKRPILVDRRAYRITVCSHTDKNICDIISFSYPDTLVPESTKVWQYTGSVLSGMYTNNCTYQDSEEGWDKTFQANNATKMSFFFFSVETLNKYGWEGVRTHYRVLVRKDFSLQGLKNNNYTLAYP